MGEYNAKRKRRKVKQKAKRESGQKAALKLWKSLRKN